MMADSIQSASPIRFSAVASPEAPGKHAIRVNGHVVCGDANVLDAPRLRQRVFTELLRQQAIAEQLLQAHESPPAYDLLNPIPDGGAPGLEGHDGPDFVLTEATANAIESLVQRHVRPVLPDEASCERYFAAKPELFRQGEQIELRHILLAVTDGIDPQRLRQRATQLLLDVRTDQHTNPLLFSSHAQAYSNCPSGAYGGYLGWLTQNDCVPEFAKAVFGTTQLGVMPELVHSRFGFHLVQVLTRNQGVVPTFASVKHDVSQRLFQQSFAAAMRAYLQTLASDASLEGLDGDTLFQTIVH